MGCSAKSVHKGALIAAAFLTTNGIAAAQDVSLNPTYETVDLNAGFAPDPYTINLSSGGSIDARDLSGQCRGYIANAPDVRLHYDNGSGILPLIIMVEASADTTLVVNAPNGSWYCDDDTGEGLNPLMRFDEPLSGRYEIWVGTYSDSSLEPATLLFSELDSTINNASTTSYSSRPDATLSPSYGSVDLSAGFTPDPYTVNLRSGGSIEASSVNDSCRGYVAAAPDVSVNYSNGSLPLILSANSSSDTTILVNDPNGNWYCDDDSGEGLNPSLRFEKPLSGRYDVWIGTYGSDTYQDATLHISELYSE